MRRSLFLLICAATSLALLSLIGWMKWNRAASMDRLKFDIQAIIFDGLDLQDTTLRPADIKVEINPIEKRWEQSYFFEGKLTIPRKPFAVVDPATKARVRFEPLGNVEIPFFGSSEIQKEPIAAARWLGAIHPTWSGTSAWLSGASVNGEQFLDPSWKAADRDKANAVFDAHLAFRKEIRFARYDIRENAILLISARALRALDRPDESALLASSIQGNEYLAFAFEDDILPEIEKLQAQ